MTETQTNTFLALDQAYTSGNTQTTKRIEAILFPEKVELPKELQTVLDKIGDTPVAEPAIYTALSTVGTEAIDDELAKLVDLDKFDILAIGVFTFRVKAKVLDFTDKDGVYKSTPNLDKLTLPKVSAIKELVKMLGSSSQEELSDKVFEMVALKKKGLTTWETTLVETLVMAFATSYLNSTASGFVDRTPFGKYLKN